MPAKKPTKAKAEKRRKSDARYQAFRAEWERQKNEPKPEPESNPKPNPDGRRPRSGFVPDPNRRPISDRGAADWLIDKPDLPLDALPFLKTLRRLGYVLQDWRFTDLHRDLISSGMVDLATGKWSRYGTVLANRDTLLVCELIEENIAAGVSEREAIAEAVVELNIDAQSFVAAWQRIKRLLDEYRKSVKQKHP